MFSLNLQLVNLNTITIVVRGDEDDKICAQERSFHLMFVCGCAMTSRLRPERFSEHPVVCLLRCGALDVVWTWVDLK